MKLFDADIFTSELDFVEADVCEEFPDGYCEFGFSREKIRKLLRDIPTVDAVPVVHGRWITTSGEVFPGSSQFLCYSHKHDECGFQYVDMNENEYNYCPNCGCRMDGVVE